MWTDFQNSFFSPKAWQLPNFYVYEPIFKNSFFPERLAQQLSGINAAIFFSTSIFTEAGLDEHAAQSATLGMGAMNVAMTVISLILIEKAGRKTLMITGLVIMLLTTVMLLICLLVAVSTFERSEARFFLAYR